MPRRNLILILAAIVVSWLCYERAARNRYAATIAEAMNIVTARYLNEVEPRVLFEGAMDGMIGKLDPYSAYTSPDELADFQQQLDGSITGIGIIVDGDNDSGELVVLEALVGKPAYLAGIRAGDKIVAIDGIQTSRLSRRDAIKLIRGRPGTKVKIRVLHAGRDQQEHELERATIPVESVLGDARGKDGQWLFRLANHPHLGYIRIVSFGERTGDEFREALASYRRPNEQIRGLIIDLRYNPGGLLPAAVAVCDSLLDAGLIVTTRGRNGLLMEQHIATPGTDLPPDVPLVVLVDHLSASASEIIAGCLQDHHRAAVVGQRTWGKGTVQNVIELEGGKSAIRLTVGSYHRPSGKEIHKWKTALETDDWGVRPDPGLEVPLTSRQIDLIIAARRKRDLIQWDELVAAPDVGSPSSVPASSLGPHQQIAPASSVDADADLAARDDPTRIDPQLRKAVEHLHRQFPPSLQKS